MGTSLLGGPFSLASIYTLILHPPHKKNFSEYKTDQKRRNIGVKKILGTKFLFNDFSDPRIIKRNKLYMEGIIAIDKYVEIRLNFPRKGS